MISYMYPQHLFNHSIKTIFQLYNNSDVIFVFVPFFDLFIIVINGVPLSLVLTDKCTSDPLLM